MATKPKRCGYELNFYRTAMAGIDPMGMEKAFGSMEGSAGPILRGMFRVRRQPMVEELENLMTFIAFQYSRVPSFRPFVLNLARSIHRDWLLPALKTPETWDTAVEGWESSAPPPTYADGQRILEKYDSFEISAPTEWFLIKAYDASKKIYPHLAGRNWQTLVSSTGSFIGSDNPVYLDGPAETLIGFKSADLVLFPANRHCYMIGTNRPSHPIFVTRTLIAAQNTLTILHANEQVYSHRPDFAWLDGLGKHQTDWRMFSKDRVMEDRLKTMETRRNRPEIRLY
jgi:hypothetical protein